MNVLFLIRTVGEKIERAQQMIGRIDVVDSEPCRHLVFHSQNSKVLNCHDDY